MPEIDDVDFEETCQRCVSEGSADIATFATFLSRVVEDEGIAPFTDLGKFKWKPADPRTFVESAELMNKKDALWPEVMKAFIEINNGTYTQSVLTGPIGVAKCLGRDTPVLMADGTVRAVQDVRVGDLLMGPDSLPRKVVSVACGVDEMFRVRQIGGEDYVVNSAHILSLRYTFEGHGGQRRADRREITVTDYMALAKSHRAILKGWKPDLVEFQPKPVYDPYLLGLWLGDGHSEGPRFTTTDQEIVEYLKGVAKRHGLRLSEHDDMRGNQAKLYGLGQLSWRSNPYGNHVREWLRDLGLIGNKHIPQAYLTASVEDRRLLLAGLLDTDGNLTPSGTFTISQKRKVLSDGIVFIARSLGMRATTRTETIGGCVYYRTFLSGATDQIPTRLPRKQAKPRRQIKNINRWGIEVESLGQGEYFGFELDGPDRLFMLGDFTVTHNTTLAVYTQAYQLYLMSCLSNPHGEFDLDKSSEIVIIFQSITMALAKTVSYARFRDMIAKAPYFKKSFPFNVTLKSEMQFPNRIIIKPVAGTDTGAIGQNVIGGIIDEVNFMAVVEDSRLSRDGQTYDQAENNYNTIAQRRISRFRDKGWMPGMLCLVSSRNYPGQLTDKIEERALTDRTIYIYDRKGWDLRPWRFSDARFRLFTGDESRKPKILEDTDVVADKDQKLVMLVPEDYREEFNNDPLRTVRDVCGVSTLALHPFMMNTEAVASCFGKAMSIVAVDKWDFSAGQPQLYPLRVTDPDEPRAIHIDLSQNKDSTGIACGYVKNFVKQMRGDHPEDLPLIKFDFVLEYMPPKGGEIEIENVRQLIYKIREKLRLNIKYVSFDQFQSTDSQQIMQKEGFQTCLASVDKDTLAYDLIKSAFYDGRIEAPAHIKAQREFAGLELDVKHNKVDHPPNGSKDCSDAMAGVVFGLMRQRATWSRHNVAQRNIPDYMTRPIIKQEVRDAEKKKKMDSMSYVNRLRYEKGLVSTGSDDE